MKSIRKENLKSEKEKNNCVVERTILEKLKSEFVVQLHFAFQTPDKIYFVVDYMQGGDLFYHLKKNCRFCEKKTKFYIAQCVLALKDMHKRGIIYRDLKLENIMLDCEGNIKITDFGLSKLGIEQNKLVYSFVGTPEYLSPEIVKGSGYNKTTDWWSLGAIMYEMLVGRSPFRNFLAGLLERDKDRRLGAKQGALDIMKDPFFDGIDWVKLRNKLIPSPFKPKCTEDCQAKYFANEFLSEEAHDSFVLSELSLSEKQENYFEDFTYSRDNKFLKDEENRETNKVSKSFENCVIWEIDSKDEKEHSNI